MHIHTNTFEKSSFDPMKLNVLQRILLTTNGRVTDIIQAYSNESIYAVKLSQEVETLVEAISVLEITNKHRILRLKVLLRGKKSQTNFLYADSLLVLIKQVVFTSLVERKSYQQRGVDDEYWDSLENFSFYFGFRTSWYCSGQYPITKWN
ncbi:hypothetical protein [Nostoc commune]|uniref:hypothetical protein n=1 Tax=Nostoc commune TaxID=1178 RepID=UPI0018C5EBD3|nr:hypothetical protein [Nostoc commune]